ncbi:MAG: hypothetical protein LOD92_06440 [Bacillales bacterium]
MQILLDEKMSEQQAVETGWLFPQLDIIVKFGDTYPFAEERCELQNNRMLISGDKNPFPLFPVQVQSLLR